MTVNLTKEPTDTHSRYVLVFKDAPALVTIEGLIEHRNDEDLLAIVVVAADGSCEPVELDQDDDGTWVVYRISDEGAAVIEEILFSESREVVLHQVFVDGYTTDQVPTFTFGVG